MGARAARGERAGRTVLVTAYAKAPHGTSMYEVYKHCGVVLEIDPLDHRVVAAEFTVITDLAGEFLRRLVVGYDVSRGVEPLARKLSQQYLAPSQQAMIRCLAVAFQRYNERAGHREQAAPAGEAAPSRLRPAVGREFRGEQD